jgi:hypothetical protein
VTSNTASCALHVKIYRLTFDSCAVVPHAHTISVVIFLQICDEQAAELRRAEEQLAAVQSALAARSTQVCAPAACLKHAAVVVYKPCLVVTVGHNRSRQSVCYSCQRCQHEEHQHASTQLQLCCIYQLQLNSLPQQATTKRATGTYVAFMTPVQATYLRVAQLAADTDLVRCMRLIR